MKKQYKVRYTYDILEIDCPVFTAGVWAENKDKAKIEFMKNNENAEMIGIEEIKTRNYSLPY